MKKAILLLGLTSVGGGAWWAWPSAAPAVVAGASAVAKRGDFKVTVIEQGAFTAKDSVQIKVQMEVYHNQLTITKVSDQGAAVKKGDVILELDASELVQMKAQAEVDVQTASNDLVQATQDLAIQELKNRIEMERAQYDVDAAALKLKKYIELEGPKAIKEAEAKIRDAINNRDEMTQNHKFLLDMKKEDLVSEAEVKRAELAAKKAEGDLEIAQLSLALTQKFEQPLENQRLKNLHADAKSFQAAKQGELNAQTMQKKSGLLRADSALKQKKTHLEKVSADLDHAVVRAPVDGIVQHGDPGMRFWGQQIKVGVGEKVQPHFAILTIPDLSAFKVKLAVSEAEVNKVKAGQSVTIRPEALPDAVLSGVIKSVGTVPSARENWMDDPSRSKFDVEIEVAGVDPRLKPGMKGRVEIAVDDVKAALHVPLDSVFERDGRTFCYVLAASKPEERQVKVGRSSADFVEILEGLAEGDKVALYDPTKK